MAQLYANENFPAPVVEELRRFGHDVLTTYESGRAGIAMPDDEMLAFSVAEKRVLLNDDVCGVRAALKMSAFSFAVVWHSLMIATSKSALN